MIKRLLLIAALALGLSAAADDRGLSANQRTVGYTTTDQIDVDGAAVGTAGTYTVGAIINPDQLAFYAGCRLVGLRIAAGYDLGRSRTFVYDLANNNLDEVHVQNQKLYKGWNNIFFNGDGYELTGKERLFYGFDYVETAEMVAADKGGLCGVGADIMGAACMLYPNGNIYTISEIGALCIQLIVDVTNLPARDMAVTFLDSGFKYKKVGEQVEVAALIKNVGKDTIPSFTVAYGFDGVNMSTEDITAPLAPGADAQWTKKLTAPTDCGVHSFTLAIDKIDGQLPPERPYNTSSTIFAVYETALQRNKVYLEVYADQNNPYWALLDQALAGYEGINDKVALAKVYAPDQPLAAESSTWLHGIYAYTTPSFSVNRSQFPGEKNIAYDFNDFLGVLPSEMIAGILDEVVLQDLTTPAFATLDLDHSYDATTRTLTVNTTGTILPEAKDIYGDIAATVMIVEDGITATQSSVNEQMQAFNDRNYKHRSVVRDYLTDSKGDKLILNGESFSATYSGKISPQWKPDNIRVIAILTKAGTPTKAKAADFDVINTATSEAILASGIESVSTTAPERWHSIDGRPITSPTARGIYLRTTPQGTVKVIR